MPGVEPPPRRSPEASPTHRPPSSKARIAAQAARQARTLMPKWTGPSTPPRRQLSLSPPPPPIPKRSKKRIMPALTLNTSPQPKRQGSVDPFVDSHQSPPPVSPITPTGESNKPRATYTHTQQQTQTSIPLPPFIPIKFNTNPDVLALQAQASILQIQLRQTEQDIQTLSRVQEKALASPERFVKALQEGRVKMRGDPLFHPQSGPDNDVAMEDVQDNEEVKAQKEFSDLPGPQNVPRMPPINWSKYAVMGESLDKMHEDQARHPSDGMPQRLGPDGQLIAGGEGVTHNETFIAAPFRPGIDKIDKKIAKKGSRR